MSRRALAAVVALAAATAACGPGTPFEDAPACPHDASQGRTPRVEVLVSSFTTVVRRDLSLERLSRLPAVETVGPGGRLQGLTVVRDHLDYRTDVTTRRRLFGGTCAWIGSLTVDLTPQLAEIDVPSDYPEDSCEYQQILAHERLHDDTHRDALADAAEEMRAALAKADWLPARGTPLAAAGRPEAERRIQAMVGRIVEPVYARFQERLAERQAVIDLPENYRWTASRCSHWK